LEGGKWGNSPCKDRRVDVMMRGAVENIVRWLFEGGRWWLVVVGGGEDVC
jgi:hypothetical protein